MKEPKHTLVAELSASSPAFPANVAENLPGENPVAAPVISASADDYILPMSFGQEQLWMIDQMGPGNTAYNVLAPLRIRGRLNITVLERTLNEILSRHEVLRTRFDLDGSVPVQIISKTARIPFVLVDLSNVPEHSQEAELMRCMSEIATLPFNLQHGPLCRAHLLKLGSDHHVLLWNMHHIVSDGWSYTVLTQEIGSIFPAFLRGAPSPLSELSIQYADYSQWQRAQFTPERIASEVAWWQRQLKGSPAFIELPTDRPFGQTPSFNGRMRTLHFQPDLMGRLHQLAKELDTTIFTVTFATFFVLMHRYTGQSELVLGTPIANRGSVEVEPLIGYFVNNLPIPMSLAERLTFSDLVVKLRGFLADVYEHQALPFSVLVAELLPDRSNNRNPVFQVDFQCHKAFIRLPQIAGLEFTHIHIDRCGAPLELGFSMIERDGRWRVSAEYSTEVFNEQTIDRMLVHYQTLLEGIVAKPNQRVSDLNLLAGAERQQLLVKWNDTAAEYPRDKCIHELFEAQAERAPESVAVIFEGQQLTYRELNERANQLAWYLRKLGVLPDTLVGICVERSLEMLVGLLGTLKAGGAYVPLDPDYPQERLAFMIEDSAPKVLLTQDRFKGLFQGLGMAVPVIDLTVHDASPWLNESKSNPDRAAVGLLPHHLAYVIYTSGSTGKPKGVAVEHRALCNQITALKSSYQFYPEDRILQFASFNFDASVEEIFGTLLSGAALIMRSDAWLAGPHDFLKLCQAQKVSVIDLPTRFWQMLADTRNIEIPECIRLVIIGGEAVDQHSLANWFKLDNYRPKLLNTYGPTEATIVVTIHAPAPGDLTRQSIGRPIANTRIYLLDTHGQPVPIGVAGELYIGGDGLARGYLNRPELTAEKFVPDPFSVEAGARLFRTGDRARYLPDGNIEFLGRIDEQVKIRGFRIELGEIEVQLNQHPAVRECAVVAREDVAGDFRLVAYVVAKNGNIPAAELREFLNRKVPAYMLPTIFVALEKLPLTPNGKVNRKGLPAPTVNGLEVGQAFIAPTNSIEGALVTIFQEVLKVNRISIQESFFELGGHSLLAIQVISRVRQFFEVDLPVRSLFESPTIKGLALAILKCSKNPAELETRAGLLLRVAGLSDGEVEAMLAGSHAPEAGGGE